MSEPWIISVVGGAIFGLIAVLTGVVVLRWSGQSANLEAHFESLDSSKHELDTDSAPQGWQRKMTFGFWLLYGAAIGAAMTFVLRILLAAVLGFTTSALIAGALWLAMTLIPVGIVALRRAKQATGVEIGLMLEQVAWSEDEAGEIWAICASKKVSGADLFAEDEEDTLEFHISRTEVAPVTLKVNGHVTVAQAGLDRTIRKQGLRELRLNGWLVNEFSATEAELETSWSLHHNTYAEIAKDLARAVERLGFPLRGVRLRKAVRQERLASPLQAASSRG